MKKDLSLYSATISIVCVSDTFTVPVTKAAPLVTPHIEFQSNDFPVLLTIFVKFGFLPNAALPILVTLLGIVILINWLPLKAERPISVIPSGITTDFNCNPTLSIFSAKSSPILVILTPFNILGITRFWTSSSVLVVFGLVNTLLFKIKNQ